MLLHGRVYTAPIWPADDIEGTSRAAYSIIDMGDYDISTTATTVPGSGGGGGGYFIAADAYGSYMAEDVEILRTFRDEYLLTNPAGRALVRFYYKYSPPIADHISQHKTLRLLTRISLMPLVLTIKDPASVVYIILLLGIFILGGLLKKPQDQ